MVRDGQRPRDVHLHILSDVALIKTHIFESVRKERMSFYRLGAAQCAPHYAGVWICIGKCFQKTYHVVRKSNK